MTLCWSLAPAEPHGNYIRLQLMSWDHLQGEKRFNVKIVFLFSLFWSTKPTGITHFHDVKSKLPVGVLTMGNWGFCIFAFLPLFLIITAAAMKKVMKMVIRIAPTIKTGKMVHVFSVVATREMG